MHLKNGRSTAYMWKGATWRVIVASRPIVNFWQRVALVPEIMDTSGILTVGA
jgi:hypothetical protein